MRIPREGATRFRAKGIMGTATRKETTALKAVWIMWNKQRRTKSHSDVLHRAHTRVLTTIHPGTSLSNAFVGVLGYVVYRMMAWGLESLQNLDLSVLHEMDASFIVVLSGFLRLAEYRPVVSELLGLAWGSCLCMLEVQALRRMDRTQNLLLGVIAALYGECNSVDTGDEGIQGQTTN